MKIVIEGTPEECADAIRRLAPPQDIKPVFVPKRATTIETGPIWIDPAHVMWTEFGRCASSAPKDM